MSASARAAVTVVDVWNAMPCFLNDFSSSSEIVSSSRGTRCGSSSMTVTSLPNRLNTVANSTPIGPLPRMAIDFGTVRMPMASSLVMMRVRSSSMPGTLRAYDPVATTISFAVSVCFSSPVTSTVPGPASFALPLIQVTLFFLNRNSTPRVRMVTILSLRPCTWFMSMRAGWSPRMSPHSFAACAIFSAWACSSSAFVGMHPQFRHVPPRAFCRSTTATLRPSCAARIAAG